jgi:type IV pilus assembly protein PilA
MSARLRRSLEKREEGFTLIELLVVMIIIGILAAIAIPVFLNQRAKGRDTSTKADVSTIGKEIATYYVDQPGPLLDPTFTAASGSTPATLTLIDGATVPYSSGALKLSSGTVLQGTTAGFQLAAAGQSPTSWCIGLTNSGGSQKDYKYSASGGLAPGNCP